MTVVPRIEFPQPRTEETMLAAAWNILSQTDRIEGDDALVDQAYDIADEIREAIVLARATRQIEQRGYTGNPAMRRTIIDAFIAQATTPEGDPFALFRQQ